MLITKFSYLHQVNPWELVCEPVIKRCVLQQQTDSVRGHRQLHWIETLYSHPTLQITIRGFTRQVPGGRRQKRAPDFKMINNWCIQELDNTESYLPFFLSCQRVNSKAAVDQF